MDAVYEALGNLSYADMIELGTQLRDTADALGTDFVDVKDWAQMIDAARENYFQLDE